MELSEKISQRDNLFIAKNGDATSRSVGNSLQ